jgi:hypothetical protein
MITLCSERLEIQIQEPGSQYKRSRFDWSGICQQITLNGSYTFLSQEADESNRGSEGVGLSDEFGINTPVGYDEAEIGGWFPKIGVGFLQKVSTDPYDFFFDYPIQPANIRVESSGDQMVAFQQVSKILNGWGWNLQKTYSLAGSTLTISYLLENTGQKTIQTETYNHNFLAMGGKTVGPDYQLQLPFDLQLEQLLGPIATDGNTLTLTETPPKYIYALQENCNPKQNLEWQLMHRTTGQGVRVQEEFPLFKFAIWGMRHVISPEFFLWIRLAPGEKRSWNRQYTFF